MTARKDLHLEFDARNELALSLVELERYDEALEELECALGVAERLDDRVQTHLGLSNLGELFSRAGDPRQAAARLERALDLASVLGDRATIADSMASLGRVLCELGELDRADVLLHQALGAARELGHERIEGAALGSLAGLAFARGDHGAAAELYREAARRNADDGVHLTEDLGGAVESYAALGRTRSERAQVQRLVDAAQSAGTEETAIIALVRSARWWRQRHDLDHAAELLAVAVVVGVSTLAESSGDADDEAPSREIESLGPILMAVTALHVAGPEDEDDRQVEELTSRVIDRVVEYGVSREDIDAAVAIAREALAEDD